MCASLAALDVRPASDAGRLKGIVLSGLALITFAAGAVLVFTRRLLRLDPP